ncbi:DNA repair protein [Pedobacter sp. BAL39]|uniref:JAB domain-containing protein n=1 Tax=Pedobacter sp. BAL39 TaxID=391596 RepID=UPI0001559F40|nr:JAB domain-containing protein [Pedobacter sp. BAL39]EDM35967.1 DNA repair protein [Pedobacter sp. BAL39]
MNIGDKFYKIPEIKLMYNPRVKASDRPKVGNAKETYKIFIQDWNRHKIYLIEQFKILLIDKRMSVLGIVTIGSGGLDGVYVDPKMVFAPAIISGASAIVLAHNHPSGEVTPSPADIKLTNDLVTLGEILHVKVLDHLIVTRGHYFSFIDNQLIKY